MRKLIKIGQIGWLAVMLSAPSMAADWVEESNAHAEVVLDLLAKLSPEGAGSLGVDGLDAEISDLGAGIDERSKAMIESVLSDLQERLSTTEAPKVRQDLNILIESLQNSLQSTALNDELMLPYHNVSRTIFFGLRSILDPQNSRDRYPSAIVRLEKYAGLVDGYEPFVKLAKERTEEKFAVDGLVGPYRGEVEQDLERSETLVAGIEELFANTDLQGWQQSYATLASQVRDYNQWVRDEILPRSREHYRLPEALYEDALRNWGVDASPSELIAAATKGYMDIRNEMEALAPLIAAEKGYDTHDYREVIALLKRDGAIAGDEILDHYNAVLNDIEEIIVRERLITLPDRNAGIRIASAAETAAQPAPHLQPPRLIGNTGEYPFFVIPQLTQNDDGSWQQTDSTYAAGAWTLTAHEARPGHEMQFSSIVESGVSTTRAVFAFNSANVEGWGLYAEAIVRPYLPLEGQLISLQYRLMRAARMFLDPMLNLGQITPQEAKDLIVADIAVGESWAQNEIERYTYRMPGQATAYYYGYNKMQSLRAQTELKLRDKFDQQAFHDFVLDQGLLPPHILKDAVMTEFVPQQLE